jgi:hypothetical protein
MEDYTPHSPVTTGTINGPGQMSCPHQMTQAGLEITPQPKAVTFPSGPTERTVYPGTTLQRELMQVFNAVTERQRKLFHNPHKCKEFEDTMRMIFKSISVEFQSMGAHDDDAHPKFEEQVEDEWKREVIGLSIRLTFQGNEGCIFQVCLICSC